MRFVVWSFVCESVHIAFVYGVFSIVALIVNEEKNRPHDEQQPSFCRGAAIAFATETGTHRLEANGGNCPTWTGRGVGTVHMLGEGIVTMLFQ